MTGEDTYLSTPGYERNRRARITRVERRHRSSGNHLSLELEDLVQSEHLGRLESIAGADRVPVGAVQQGIRRRWRTEDVATHPAVRLPKKIAAAVRQSRAELVGESPVRGLAEPDCLALARPFVVCPPLPLVAAPEPLELDYDPEKLRHLVNELPRQERRVIVARYGLDSGDPLSLRAVGKQLRRSAERIRQIESRALLRLKAMVTHSRWAELVW